jgi:hypothetical protein
MVAYASCERNKPSHLDILGRLESVKLIKQLEHGTLHLAITAATSAT